MVKSTTADRVQAAMNLIGGDGVLTSLMLGTKRLIVEDIRRLSSPNPVVTPGFMCVPVDFFENRTGIWIDSAFRKQILQHGHKGRIEIEQGGVLHSVTVEEALNNAQINNELCGLDVFELNDFLIYCAAMLDAQITGKAAFFSEDSPTLFHMRVKGDILAARVAKRNRDDGSYWECRFDGSGVGNSGFGLPVGTQVYMTPAED